MTATNVTVTAACPACGADAIRYGTHVEPGGVTAYRIACLACDGPTVTPEPETEAVPPAPVPERLNVLRQLQARWGWST